jgi:FAD/FMN-containing dehydrogenase
MLSNPRRSPARRDTKERRDMFRSKHHRAQQSIAEIETVLDRPRMALKFSAADASRLQAAIQGSVITMGGEQYHQARQGFVVNYQAFPQIIVYCEIFNDVAAALAFAHKHGLVPVCRSGAHNTAGYSVNDEMVIDISRINYVIVERNKKEAVVGAGTTFGRLNAILESNGVHVPGGGCDDVAVAGFMQGGGYGFTSMIFGMNCDSVVAATVMLADGTIVVASETSEPELFWALRGGTGNNFGVLLEITYKVQELRDLWGFGIRWRLGQDDAGAKRVSAALAFLQARYTGSAAPAGFGHQSTLNFVGKEPYLLLRGMYYGESERGEALVADLLRTDGAELDIKGRRGSYSELNDFLNGHPDVPEVVPHTRTQADSRYIERRLSTDEWFSLAKFFQKSPNLGNFIGLEAYGGAIAMVEPSASAFLHRRAAFDVYIWVFWLNDDEKYESLTFLEGFRKVLEPLGNGHAYQNYQNRANAGYREMYWGSNLPRLVRAKEHYDPTHLFRFGQTIV